MTRLLVLAVMLLGGPAAAQAPGPLESELTVFAAASLSGAFQELGDRFERAHPRTRIRFSFAGSQQLALQLEQGAHADLLAFADERWARHLAGLGLLAGAPEIFAHNRLVVIVPAANPAGIGRLEDLARAGVKTVVAAPAVPAGGYTREVLARLARAPGFPADYARRVLANVVSEEENVKAVVAKVQLGEVDAGVAYASDAAGPAGRRLRVIPIPDERNVVADYPIAVLRAARAPRAAAAFAVLVLGPEGRRVLARHGLAPGTPPIGPATAGHGRPEPLICAARSEGRPCAPPDLQRGPSFCCWWACRCSRCSCGRTRCGSRGGSPSLRSWRRCG